jgi:hypothetical protein
VDRSLLLVAALLVSACASDADVPALGFANETDVAVGVYVNGSWVGTYAAGTEGVGVPYGGRGGPPWRIEFRTPSGATIASWDLTGDDIAFVEGGAAGTGTLLDTPCGRIIAWVGQRGSGGPAPDPNVPSPTPGPCQ